MEAIIVLGLLTSVALASLRWGYDSRDTIRSKEQELAACGVSWHDLVDDDVTSSVAVVLPADYAVGHVNGV